jgi:2-polyprenyl-3-methyl-5-hydroxy-6-metoxy-1,4-benzoquinol methylase
MHRVINWNSKTNSCIDSWKQIEKARLSLLNKIYSIKNEKVDLSEFYSHQFSNNYFIQIELRKYAHILSLSIGDRISDLDRMVLVDYGGGLGLISLFAKELGIGTVIYNDLFEGACENAAKIGQIIGNPADNYVTGDIDDLIGFLSHNKIDCDVITSYDVLEHIYDIDYYLKRLKFLSNGPVRLVMCSGANQYNPIIKKKIVKRQIQIERHGRKDWPFVRSCDHKEPYYQIRMKIIKDHSFNLCDEDAELIAKATRGKIEADIIRDVIEYEKLGKIPNGIGHSTNTCDPYTGYWEEHFMDPFQLSEILISNGFNSRVLPGYWYYADNAKMKSKLLLSALNAIIKSTENLITREALHFAPFYIVYANKALNSDR